MGFSVKIVFLIVMLLLSGCGVSPPAFVGVKDASVRQDGAEYLDRVLLSINSGTVNVDNRLMPFRPVAISLVQGHKITTVVVTESGVELEMDFMLDVDGITIDYDDISALLPKVNEWRDGHYVHIGVVGEYPRLIFRNVDVYFRADHSYN